MDIDQATNHSVAQLVCQALPLFPFFHFPFLTPNSLRDRRGSWGLPW
jgi:hypothetical protein